LDKAQVNGTEIAYETRGQGEPLLLIHGAGVSHREFQPQYEALGAKFRLILPDVRGHGESGQMPTPYTIKQFADDMIALLNYLGFDKAFVLGHSMGGGIAQQIAVGYPERVPALVLAETAYGFGRHSIIRFLLAINGGIVRLLGMKRMVDLSVRQLAQTEEARKLLRETFQPQLANPANFWNVYGALTTFDGREQLKRIQCPTLILIADRNRISHGSGRTMAALIPNAALKMISNAGHGLNWDNPEAFNQTVIEFLEQQTTGKG
jgi:3-oxoadipate enol-lactonase